MSEFFYHETIHRCASAFADIFNDIKVARKDDQGNLTNQSVLYISYGPKQKFLERLDREATLDDSDGLRVQTKLPRLSYEMAAPAYDSSRQGQKMAVCSIGNGHILRPVPYIIPFTLSLLTRGHQEAFQVLEQILPLFAPSFSFEMYPIKGSSHSQKVDVTLKTVSKTDSYEGNFTDSQLLIHTLEFDMTTYLYGRINTESAIIKRIEVNLRDLDGDLLEKTSLQVTPSTAEKNDSHTIVESIE